MSIYYYQTNIICLLLLLIMLVTMSSRRGVIRSRQVTFYVIVITTAVMCITDPICWALSGKMFPGVRFLLHFGNILYYASITFVSYVWLIYVRLWTKEIGYDNRKDILIGFIPMGIMLLILLTNPVTGVLYTLDANNVYARSGGVFVHWIISYGYMVAATLETLRAMRKEKSKLRRDELRPLLMFIIWPVVAALVQMFFYGITATQCGITLSIITITMQSLKAEITTDELTGLNNRAAFERFVSDRMHNVPQGFSVMLCDVDKFKNINDTMGHGAGDMVLKYIADTLRKACSLSRADAFLCRYGGDEFVFCAAREDETFETLVEKITEQLNARNEGKESLVKISISYGVAGGTCHTHEDFTELVKLADEAMYRQKQEKKMGR